MFEETYAQKRQRKEEELQDLSREQRYLEEAFYTFSNSLRKTEQQLEELKATVDFSEDNIGAREREEDRFFLQGLHRQMDNYQYEILEDYQADQRKKLLDIEDIQRQSM